MKTKPSLAVLTGFLLLLTAPMVRAQGLAITCPGASTNECSVATMLAVTVTDTNGSDLTVVWSLNGMSVQTNSVSGTTVTNGTNVAFSAMLPLGTNLVDVTATDTSTNSASCSTTVTVVETSPPTIESVDADPDVLWPPNHRMVPIKLDVVVTNECEPATWKVLSVTSNEAQDAHGSGHTAPDWKITGDHTVSVRAERAGPGHGRVYTITIQASNAGGNTAQATVTVTVPHDQGHHGGNSNSGNNGHHGNSSNNGNHGNGNSSNNGNHHPHGP